MGFNRGLVYELLTFLGSPECQSLMANLFLAFYQRQPETRQTYSISINLWNQFSDLLGSKPVFGNEILDPFFLLLAFS